MRYIPWILFGLAALGLVGFVGYYFGHAKPNDTTAIVATVTPGTSTTPVTTGSQPEVKVTPTPDPKADWKVLANVSPAFSLKYPSSVELKTTQEGTKLLVKTGPTQKENTEFYDGISINIKTGSLDGKTVKQFADQKAAELGGVFETSPVIATTVGTLPGFKFHVKGYAEAEYYYLDLGTNSYLEIIDATKDPSNAGFIQTVSQILATLSQ